MSGNRQPKVVQPITKVSVGEKEEQEYDCAQSGFTGTAQYQGKQCPEHHSSSQGYCQWQRSLPEVSL